MRLKSEFLDEKTQTVSEVPSIRLRPEQIEEIQLCDYSLLIFYATRIQPLSLAEMKESFPEPESYKAQSVINRFLAVGLIRVTPDEKYYSNYPENYVNYSDYRYDRLLEARKDKKVFNLMKQFTGIKEYWRDKSYFSMDAFYTDEQTKEVQAMFNEIKAKLKQYSNENAKKQSIKGMKFRRIKFFDMFFAILLVVAFNLVGAPEVYAQGADTSTDSQMMDIAFNQASRQISGIWFASGGGNDPTIMIQRFAPRNQDHIRGHIEQMEAIVASDFSYTDPMSLIYGANTAAFVDQAGASFEEIVTEPIDEILIDFKKDLGNESADSGGGHDPTVRPGKPCFVKELSAAGYARRVACPYVKILRQLYDCRNSENDCSELETTLEQLLEETSNHSTK